MLNGKCGINRVFDVNFYKGKKILITGHTGFKGTWLCKMLLNCGADVVGYALENKMSYSIFDIAGIRHSITSITGDIRDYKKLRNVFQTYNPEIVFHLAAQPLVYYGYEEPRYTFETNIMGTINVLECIRNSDSVKSFLNVTTDKVYMNREWEWGYRENELLDGYDPYSNSKSCSELVTHCYKRVYFNKNVSISTARAGNVIGGGDFSKNRIMPDCINAAIHKKRIVVRNPDSIRPYQHVLEPLYAYLMIAAKQYDKKSLSGYYNVGPDESDCSSTIDLVKLFVHIWNENLEWEYAEVDGPHEANFLKLDCSKLKNTYGWRPLWNLKQSVTKTVEWSKCWRDSKNVELCMDNQIEEFLNGMSKK